MTLILISGDVRKGKTLLMTYMVSKYPEVPIYSNYKLNLANAQTVDVYTLSCVQRGIVLLDEAYALMESRHSGTDVNLYISHIIFNSGKRGLDIIVSCQLSSTLDLRLRSMANIKIVALGLAKDGSGYIYVVNEKAMFLLPIETAREIYPLYDTYQEQESVRPTLYDADKINPKIDDYSKKILQAYGRDTKITKGMTKDHFLQNKWDIALWDLAYNRIKTMQAVKVRK